MHPRSLLSLGAALLAAGCASSSSPPVPAPASPSADGTSSVKFTMTSHVAAGTEAHQCQLVTMPDDGPGFVVAGSHSYTPGSHHVLLFRTDLTAAPDGMSGVFDCTSETGIMGHVRGIVYGAQTPSGQWTLPDAVGLPFRAGEILLMQAHYLDATAQDLDAEVDVTLTLRSDGITDRAGFFFFYDPFIHVPSGARATASMRCLVPQDVTLLGAASHYHRRGVGYSATLDPPGGALGRAPFYTSSDWSHPLPLQTRLEVAAGSRIRFECDYDNTTGTRDYYAGSSAEDNEMCMFIGLYYPDLGAQDDFCLAGPDWFGTGATNCATATACLRACPPAKKSSFTDEDPCVQRCFADSCATASAPLLDQIDCVESQCANECGKGDGDCTACATSKCAKQVAACQAHRCE